MNMYDSATACVEINNKHVYAPVPTLWTISAYDPVQEISELNIGVSIRRFRTTTFALQTPNTNSNVVKE